MTKLGRQLMHLTWPWLWPVCSIQPPTGLITLLGRDKLHGTNSRVSCIDGLVLSRRLNQPRVQNFHGRLRGRGSPLLRPYSRHVFAFRYGREVSRNTLPVFLP